MTRALLIKLHLYCSAFFSAAIVLVALSGGLYLIGIKGTIDQTRIGLAGSGEQLLAEPSIEAVHAVLTEVGVTDFEFDYVKQKGSQLITRPTTRPFYTLDVSGNDVVVQYNEPSLQKKMIELHMGHGPVAYKTYQKIFAAGMLFIILSGLWAGLSSTKLRGPTAAVAGGGLLVFALLAMSYPNHGLTLSSTITKFCRLCSHLRTTSRPAVGKSCTTTSEERSLIKLPAES